MAQESPNRLVEWYLTFRQWMPAAKRGVRDWYGQVRAEPALLWESVAVRCTLYAAGGLLCICIVWWLGGLITPPPPSDAKPIADKAYFHVMCSDSACRHHFTVYQKKSFDDFPVTCPRCKRTTGHAARQCFSKSCGGRWVIPQPKDESHLCPACGQPL